MKYVRTWTIDVGDDNGRVIVREDVDRILGVEIDTQDVWCENLTDLKQIIDGLQEIYDEIKKERTTPISIMEAIQNGIKVYRVDGGRVRNLYVKEDPYRAYVIFGEWERSDGSWELGAWARDGKYDVHADPIKQPLDLILK